MTSDSLPIIETITGGDLSFRDIRLSAFHEECRETPRVNGPERE